MNIESLSYLDNLRTTQSITDFKWAFMSLLKEDRKKAIEFLNENNLLFPSLFLLIPEIEAFELTNKLNWRNKLTVKICNIMHSEKRMDKIMKLSSEKKILQVLQWIFETGVHEDGLNDDYDQVLDDVTSLLINKYHNDEILPTVADMIFIRNRKGMYIHDLVWSYFNSCNPITLKLVANYIQSKEYEDVQLAYKLLHLDSSEFHVQNADPKTYFKAYRRWLDENVEYLYFTDESLQLTSEPIPCKVNIEAKYLNKKVFHKSGKPKKPLTRTENNYLNDFKQVENDDKELLSKYSHKIFRDNVDRWRKWIENDIHEQIQNAKNDMEGY